MSIWDMFRASKIKTENERLQATIQELKSKLDGLGAKDYYEIQEKIKDFNEEINIQGMHQGILLKETKLYIS